MKGRRDTGIPKFKSLEEEREYWEAHGPVADGHTGRINKPRTGQKRSSFLAVRLTGEELTRIRDVAAKQGLGPSTFARLILTSVIERRGNMPKHLTLDELKNMLEQNLPQSIKDQAESLASAASIGGPDNPTFLIDNSQVSVWEEFGLQVISRLLAMDNFQIVSPEHAKDSVERQEGHKLAKAMMVDLIECEVEQGYRLALDGTSSNTDKACSVLMRAINRAWDMILQAGEVVNGKGLLYRLIDEELEKEIGLPPMSLEKMVEAGYDFRDPGVDLEEIVAMAEFHREVVQKIKMSQSDQELIALMYLALREHWQPQQIIEAAGMPHHQFLKEVERVNGSIKEQFERLLAASTGMSSRFQPRQTKTGRLGDRKLP